METSLRRLPLGERFAVHHDAVAKLSWSGIRTDFLLDPVPGQAKTFAVAADNCPPDGTSGFEYKSKLLDPFGRPLSGVRIDGVVQAVQPTTGWRNVDEVAAQFGGSAAKLKQKVAAGQIRLLGTLF